MLELKELGVYPEDNEGDPHELYAYVSIDERGKSGICSCQLGNFMVPFVSPSLRLINLFTPIVNKMREETDKTIKLIRYTAEEFL